MGQSKMAKATARRAVLAVVGWISENGPLAGRWDRMGASDRAAVVDDLVDVVAPLCESLVDRAGELADDEVATLLSALAGARGHRNLAETLAELHRGMLGEATRGGFEIVGARELAELKAVWADRVEVGEAPAEARLKSEDDDAPPFAPSFLDLTQTVYYLHDRGARNVDVAADRIRADFGGERRDAPPHDAVDQMLDPSPQTCDCGKRMRYESVEDGNDVWRCECGAVRAVLKEKRL